jgi:hypothetical protein
VIGGDDLPRDILDHYKCPRNTTSTSTRSFSARYLKEDGMPAMYSPDFLIRLPAHVYVVETKSQSRLSDKNVLRKQPAAVAWCEQIVGDHTVVLGKLLECRRPIARVGTDAVDQEQWRALAGGTIEEFPARHRDCARLLHRGTPKSATIVVARDAIPVG